MARIESPELHKAESCKAERRIAASTEALITGVIAFQKFAIARKGGDPNRISDTEEFRTNMRLEIGRCAAYATAQ